jgi:RNA recognition motif-containing protein
MEKHIRVDTIKA